MNRRHFIALAATGSLAGCTGRFGNEENSRLDLTVRNDRTDPVTVQVVVVGADGTTYTEESDTLEPGVSRAFEAVVGREGRREVTVSGDDFSGQLAWDAGTCRLFDGTVRVTDEAVEVAGECVDQR
ncbi:hypothetical protein C474_02496 [Halogeometricum pallidum JCM 14848]|uniref:Lipoprotein n=1 Tax=Halogeometricum pallidum JCM 14848 TaxID=1227487 RepID=M0DID2_HALPD|nr:hypothetical protein [Halogeometricum pallidum]ELZ34538.1 hypothetical protein C474_02496 [Halogeometricum pallidum JCM 14848]